MDQDREDMISCALVAEANKVLADLLKNPDLSDDERAEYTRRARIYTETGGRLVKQD